MTEVEKLLTMGSHLPTVKQYMDIGCYFSYCYIKDWKTSAVACSPTEPRAMILKKHYTTVI